MVAKGAPSPNRGKPSPMRGKKLPPEHLRRSEIDALLATFDARRPVELRNRALLVTLWRTGLRISEALALRPLDVDLEYRTIRVLHGKGDKARTVGFDPGCARELRGWIELRGRVWAGSPASPLFCTREGALLQTSYVRAMLPRAARAASIERRVHAHMFRHTFAVELVRAGVPVPHVQRLLGHASLATTANYIASLSPEEALDFARGRDDF